MNEVLYHYCSVDTFRKILENKTLRFSDVTKSNDDQEIILLWNKYHEQIKKQATNKFAVASQKLIIDQQLENTAFLALCFSKEQDSSYMWTHYANAGAGVAIGFDFDKLKSWTKSICMHNPINKNIPNCATIAKLGCITYSNSEQLEAEMKEFCKDVKSVTDGFKDIFNTAPFLKREDFIDEKEVRIMITAFISDVHSNKFDYVDDNGKFISESKLATASNAKFPHVLICDFPFDMSMIRSITIGSNCSLTKTDVVQMLFANGLLPNTMNIDINKSKGSYR